MSLWHGLHGVSSSYDYFDIEGWDAHYACYNFELTLHWNRNFVEWLVIGIPHMAMIIFWVKLCDAIICILVY